VTDRQVPERLGALRYTLPLLTSVDASPQNAFQINTSSGGRQAAARTTSSMKASDCSVRHATFVVMAAGSDLSRGHRIDGGARIRRAPLKRRERVAPTQTGTRFPRNERCVTRGTSEDAAKLRSLLRHTADRFPAFPVHTRAQTAGARAPGKCEQNHAGRPGHRPDHQDHAERSRQHYR
jgi:hypothetical protein